MGLASICDVKKQKDQLWSFMESIEIVKDLFQWQTWTKPKLMQLDKALYKWFTAMCLEWKCVTGTKIETAECFYDEMKMTDKCTFSEGSNKKITCKNLVSIGTVW
jgi:hypothetical protein